MENARYRAFLTSAEAGSFTKAAEALSYTPSAVSQLVSALEGELGFALLSRDKRGVKLTSNGERVLAVVREVLWQEEHLRQVAAEISGLATGSITIGSYPSMAAHWLPATIRDFHAQYPGIEIHLMEGLWQEISQWLDEKKIDMAFFSYEEPMEYEWIPLADDPMVAVLPIDHPFAHAKAYPLSNCQNEVFIMPALGHDYDVVKLFRNNSLSPEIGFSTLENFSTMAMIEQGLGMSIMNELCTQKWDLNIVRLPLDPPQYCTLGIALHSLKDASPAVRRFTDYAVQKLRK